MRASWTYQWHGRNLELIYDVVSTPPHKEPQHLSPERTLPFSLNTPSQLLPNQSLTTPTIENPSTRPLHHLRLPTNCINHVRDAIFAHVARRSWYGRRIAARCPSAIRDAWMGGSSRAGARGDADTEICWVWARWDGVRVALPVEEIGVGAL